MTGRRSGSLTPEKAIADLDEYLRGLGFALSSSARTVFDAIERWSLEKDGEPFPWDFLLVLLQQMQTLRTTVKLLGGDPERAIDLLATEGRISADRRDHYANRSKPYSVKKTRWLSPRTTIIDLCLAVARGGGRREIFDTDILEALFRSWEEEFPPYDNETWSDQKLHVPFVTLSHILGHYDESVWVKTEDIRKSTFTGDHHVDPVESAPLRVRGPLLHLLQDYPAYDRNCFLLMSFANSKWHDAIYKTLRETLVGFGLVPLRADERSYADDLLLNVETYLYGCAFGVAVFERIETESFNPNVSLEVGYLFGLGKPVCLLKGRTLPTLHADLAGRLYTPFDVQNPKRTIPSVLTKWLKDKKIII